MVGTTPAHSIIVRPVNAHDASHARKLILDGLQERWGTLDPSKNRDLDDIILSYRKGLFLVAYSASEPVGTGALIPEGEATGRIVCMWIRKRNRGQGIGTTILRDLLRAAKQRGYTRVVLESEPDWIDPVTFYKHRGFQPIGIENGNLHFQMRLEDDIPK